MPLERDILDFFRERLNWPEDFTSDTLKPMYDKIKERNEKYKQRTMQDYYESLVQKSDGFTKIKSKRLALAVADLKGEDFDASIVFPDKQPGSKKSTTTRKKNVKKKETAVDENREGEEDKEEEESDDENAVTEPVPSPLQLAAAPPKRKKKTAAAPKKTNEKPLALAPKKKTVAKKKQKKKQ